MNLFGQGITSFSFIGIISNAKAKDISFFFGGGCFFTLVFFFVFLFILIILRYLDFCLFVYSWLSKNVFTISI